MDQRHEIGLEICCFVVADKVTLQTFISWKDADERLFSYFDALMNEFSLFAVRFNMNFPLKAASKALLSHKHDIFPLRSSVSSLGKLSK